MENTNKKAVIGIIGCGNIAKDMHLNNAFSNPRIHVKYCCDLLDENLEYVRQRYTPDVLTKDYKEVLADPEVQGVMLLTVHNVRKQMIEEAARAGKHIYVEKPMSTTPRESYDIMRIVNTYGVKLIVGFNRRVSPIVQDAVKILRDQQTDPKEVPWRYKRYGNVPLLPEEEITMVMMRINDDSASFKHYALDEFVGQGMIVSEMCHFFDLACYLTGKEPVKIYTEGRARTNFAITITFEDGSICQIFDASCGSFDHPKELIEVYNHGMSMQLDFYSQLRIGGRPDIEQIEYPVIHAEAYPEVPKGEGTPYLIHLTQAAHKDLLDGKPSRGSWNIDKGHAHLLDNLVDCILYDAEPAVSALDGSRATCMCLKAVESVRLGLPVKISRDEYDFFFAEQPNEKEILHS